MLHHDTPLHRRLAPSGLRHRGHHRATLERGVGRGREHRACDPDRAQHACPSRFRRRTFRPSRMPAIPAFASRRSGSGRTRRTASRAPPRSMLLRVRAAPAGRPVPLREPSPPAAGSVRALLARRASVRAHLIVLVVAALLPMVIFTAWLTMSLSGERRAAIERELTDNRPGGGQHPRPRDLLGHRHARGAPGRSRNLYPRATSSRFREDAERRVTPP